MFDRRLKLITMMAVLCTAAAVGIMMVPAVFATTFNTIAIDGTNDFAADETIGTTSGGYTAYTTWDANNLYLGYTGNDIGSAESSTKWIVWYIDTDPQSCDPTSGSGTNAAAGFNTQNWTLPFNADYFLQVRTDEGLNQLNSWDGASWAGTAYNGSVFDNDGANYAELSLPLSDIGNPSNVRILGYLLNEQGGGEFSYGAFPAGTFGTEGDAYKPAGVLYDWYEYDLTATGVAPNDVANQPSALNCTLDPNTTNWGFAQETGTTGSGQYVAGPGTPPAGAGSANLTVDAAADGWVFGSAEFSSVRLADVSSLSYSTYRTSGGASEAPSLQFAYDQDATDATTGWQGRLVYEPYQNGSPSTGSWETWDTINSGNGLWWASPNGTSTVDDTCSQGSPCTWITIVTTFPNIAINPTDPQILFKAGSGWSSFDGNVDNFNMTVNGVDYSYDMEPILPVHNITQGTDHPTIQDGINNATANDVIEIDPGTYVENVTVDRSVTLRGSGQGSNPAVDTILDGTTLSGNGINLDNNVTDITIESMRIANYTDTAQSSGIRGGSGNDNFTAQNLTVINNGPGFISASGGIYMNGPVDNVLIDNVTAENNRGRGIVIWNGFKTNITISNNTIRNNNCCGIELQDGTSSGVTITGNTIENNGDSGMSVLGLRDGSGVANVISGNTLTDNGRFGMEIKNPRGTGATSGDGSIVIENNNVSFTASAGMNARDHAGILVIRRDFTPGNPAGYPDVPTGVVIRNNTVDGYTHLNQVSAPTESEGFGIVVEGTNHTVTGNMVNNSMIGIQEQGGNHPNANYVPNDAGSGSQNAGDSPEYFGRGNSPVACGNDISGNTFSGNATNFRDNISAASLNLVTNSDTTETFCSIQDAIDDTDTVNGHTITVSAGTYTENVTVNKGVILNGPNAGTAGNSGSRVAEAVIDGGSGTAVTIDSSDVTVDGFQIDGAVGIATTAGLSGFNLSNNLINADNNGVEVGGTTGTFDLSNNAVNLSQQVFDGPDAGTTPGDELGEQTIGISIGGLSGANPTIIDNDINGGFYGYAVFGANNATATTISGGDITGVMQGVSVFNTTTAGSAGSNFAVNGTTVSGFSGDYPVNGAVNFHAGVYVFTGGGTTGATAVTGNITNVNVDGTGKPQSDSAALYFGDFSGTAGAQTITVNGGNITNNVNRGLFARGAGASVTATGVTLTNNGADPFGGGGNDGFSVIARNGADITVRDSTVTNPATQISAASYAFHTSSTGSSLTLVGNDVSNGNLFNINTADSLLAYANTFTGFDDAALADDRGNAGHNWWDTHTTQPTGLGNAHWAFRLGAPIGNYVDGTTSVSLADGTAGANATFTGAGTLVIVNHGSGLAAAPFGRAIDPDGAADQCGDYYDIFAINSSGTYDIALPVLNSAPCDTAAGNAAAIVQFVRNGDGSPDTACAPDSACWEGLTAGYAGNVLTASGVAAGDVQGTPFVVPSANQNDPTAVTMQSTAADHNGQTAVWVLVGLMGVLTAALAINRRRLFG